MDALFPEGQIDPPEAIYCAECKAVPVEREGDLCCDCGWVDYD